MRLGAVLYALGYALIPFATSVPLFIGFQVLLPLGTALLFPANSALVSHRTSRHEFGLMMGVQQALRGVASVLGPIWAGLAYQYLGPTVPFFACSVIIALALVLATRVRSEEPVTATA
jgi:MFS family permease